MDIQNTFRLKWGEAEIELSGDSEFVTSTIRNLAGILETARTALGLTQLSLATAPAVPVRNPDLENALPKPEISGDSSTGKPISLVEFLNQKKPRTQVEQATCIAYYKEKYDHIDSFSTRDLAEWWKMTKLKMPGNVSWVIKDACSKSFFTSIDKGHYRVTGTGDSLVDKLGSEESGSEVKPRPPRQQKPRKANESDVLKVIQAKSEGDLHLSSYPEVHALNSVIREVCWVMLVCRNELGIEELRPIDISAVLSRKFGISRSRSTVSMALLRNPSTWARGGRGKYRLMKKGEDLVMTPEGSASHGETPSADV